MALHCSTPHVTNTRRVALFSKEDPWWGPVCDPPSGKLSYDHIVIADICQLRHPQRWHTFFKAVYNFAQGTRNRLLWVKFIQIIQKHLRRLWKVYWLKIPSTLFQYQLRHPKWRRHPPKYQILFNIELHCLSQDICWRKFTHFLAYNFQV